MLFANAITLYRTSELPISMPLTSWMARIITSFSSSALILSNCSDAIDLKFWRNIRHYTTIRFVDVCIELTVQPAPAHWCKWCTKRQHPTYNPPAANRLRRVQTIPYMWTKPYNHRLVIRSTPLQHPRTGQHSHTDPGRGPHTPETKFSRVWPLFVLCWRRLVVWRPR